jgi:hypothetical protein
MCFDVDKDCTQPSVAYDPQEDWVPVVYSKDVNRDGSNWDVYGRNLVDTAAEFPIATSAADEFAPQIAFSTTSRLFLVI